MREAAKIRDFRAGYSALYCVAASLPWLGREVKAGAHLGTSPQAATRASGHAAALGYPFVVVAVPASLASMSARLWRLR